MEDRKYRGAEIRLQGKVYYRLGNQMDRLMSLDPKDRVQTVMEIWQGSQRSGSTELHDASERAVLKLPERGGEIGMAYLKPD